MSSDLQRSAQSGAVPATAGAGDNAHCCRLVIKIHTANTCKPRHIVKKTMANLIKYHTQNNDYCWITARKPMNWLQYDTLILSMGLYYSPTKGSNFSPFKRCLSKVVLGL